VSEINAEGLRKALVSNEGIDTGHPISQTIACLEF
jgi:hypothetical protein